MLQVDQRLLTVQQVLRHLRGQQLVQFPPERKDKIEKEQPVGENLTFVLLQKTEKLREQLLPGGGTLLRDGLQDLLHEVKGVLGPRDGRIPMRNRQRSLTAALLCAGENGSQ